ncbi:transporter substrate-binding domain-containing protein [Pandoraea anhela]|uniref:ABC transporter n=1 Tax=Pandoraea anhela TaxID=2508295 RepID=A0A5E4WDS9_9BURK|nr:transporter substrate-binding domain-containing protein [Pandoraea anhela]VVE21909.1 ABC transporter [Pandoraea anhela]
MKNHLTANLAILFSAIIFSSPSFSEDLGPTLEKIKSTNIISIGHRESSIPFSYYDENHKVIGFAQDICDRVIDSVKTAINSKNLAVKMIPVNSQNRIALVQNGTIDLECGTTTNTQARHSQVAFSTTYFLALTRLLVKKDSGVKDFGDLSGQNVVTNSGTTAEAMLRKLNIDRNLKFNIISSKDYAESFLALQSGRAKAFMLDDVLLSGAATMAKNPADWIVTGTPQSKEPYAFMMRKDDPKFKKIVDTTLIQMMQSGDINSLYKKWFEHPVPPKNINFNFPMSKELMDIYKNPTDTPAY